MNVFEREKNTGTEAGRVSLQADSGALKQILECRCLSFGFEACLSFMNCINIEVLKLCYFQRACKELIHTF